MFVNNQFKLFSNNHSRCIAHLFLNCINYIYSRNIRIRSMACTIRLWSIKTRGNNHIIVSLHSYILVVYDACNVFKLSLIVSIPINGMRSLEHTATMYTLDIRQALQLYTECTTKIYSFVLCPELIREIKLIFFI